MDDFPLNNESQHYDIVFSKYDQEKDYMATAEKPDELVKQILVLLDQK